MAIALGQLAQIVDGRLVGDHGLPISGAGTLDQAQDGEITFIDRPELLSKGEASQASALIVPTGAGRTKKPHIVTEDPRLAFSKVLEIFAPKPRLYPGVHPTAVVGTNVRLGESVSIGAHAFVGDSTVLGDRAAIYPLAYVGHDCTVGTDSVVYPQTFIGDRVVLGERVTVHAGASIGGDGFGYVADRNGRQRKIPQIGTVIVGDDVEIGACATVDRATVSATTIGRGTKIDDQVHIAHNVSIGEDCLICGQVGISGSAIIGNRVVLAGQVGINDHIAIGNDIVIGGQAGVFSDLTEPGYYSGYPARPHGGALRVLAATQKLPEFEKRVRQLERELAQLREEFGRRPD